MICTVHTSAEQKVCVRVLYGYRHIAPLYYLFTGCTPSVVNIMTVVVLHVCNYRKLNRFSFFNWEYVDLTPGSCSKIITVVTQVYILQLHIYWLQAYSWHFSLLHLVKFVINNQSTKQHTRGGGHNVMGTCWL